MKIRLWLVPLLLPIPAVAELHVVIIQGLAGTPEYAERFAGETERLERAAGSLTRPELVRSFSGDDATRASVLGYLGALASAQTREDRLALFLVGHGSFDGFEYKFNVPGPDLTDKDLVAALEPLPARLQLVVNTSSASGAMAADLQSDSRVVITATRSGGERNAPQFGSYFARALETPEADTDKNQAVSAQEAFDFAARQVENFYASEGRLASEHPQLAGSGAAAFLLARLARPDIGPGSPELVRLRVQREEIDAKIEALQGRRTQMDTESYFNDLQQLMIELALVEDEIERLVEAETDAPE